ncbi:carboxypeptidase-like regulatory domain-containing protein [Acidobacteriota bacterium]
MYYRRVQKFFLFPLVLAFIVFSTGALVEAAEAAKGNIVGYVFEYDSTIPIEGAVVRTKNLSTGAEFWSTASDGKGVFSIEGIESGIYDYVVTTPAGEYTAEDSFGLKVEADVTAKIAINVKPYAKSAKYGADSFAPAESIEGETFIGRIVDFNADTLQAEVFVMQGQLEWDDKIHALGEETDFYQKVDSLEVDESEARMAVPGEMAVVLLDNPAQVGDAVYVAGSRSMSAFLIPLAGVVGVAAVSAGSSAVAYNIARTQHIPDWCEPCSPYKDDLKTVSKRSKTRKKNR